MVVFSLTLVRHGETTANKDGIIQGHRDVPLSEVGMEQANLVAKRLQNEHFTHIFASDLKRAAETAQAIVKAGPENHCPIQLDKRLRERTFGDFEGKTFKDLTDAAKKQNVSWVQFTPKGAENFEDVRNRAISFFHDLCELVGKQDLAVDGEYTPASIKSKRRLDNGLSNGSQLSGCCIPSSTRPHLQDSTESQEAYVDLPTPTEDTDSSDVGLGQLRTQTSPASESAGASDSTRAHGVSKEGECVSTARDPGCVQGLTYFASNSTITSSAVQGFKGTSQDWSVFDRQSVAMFTLSSSSSSSSSSQLAQMCPNVSLSPLLEHRLSSLSSVSSGRNSSFDDADAIPTVVADVLVVSHGGLLKELVAHFIDDFHCKVPGGKSHALRICPNTGVSRFMVTLGPPGQPPAITCLLIHDKDHLKILQSAGSTTWEKSLPPI
ncbi:uncharacterized protein LOC112565631 isoform X3 [Pomacea canaliculata]|uniref:uncharacterized protein LOC112565631 isoform X3 n=1 Tax=Pomacea canaliculata TaxID=400727 RepID=UPI000D73FE53|nr:uncharacterized protein LOC112565631 isoform X3 [Pomacea canaliculata]